VIALVAGAIVSQTSTARAQTPQPGWAVDRFEPSPAGDVFFAAEHPWYTGPRRDFALRGGLVLDYANEPLVLRRGQGDTASVTPVVTHMLLAHAQFGVALFDRVGIHLSIPISLWQDGAREPITNIAPAGGPVAGDPRLGVRVRLFGHADKDAFSLHLGAQLFFNAGIFSVARGDNMTDESFRGRFNVTMAGRVSAVRWSLGAGVHLRPEPVQVLNTQLGSDAFMSAAAAYVTSNGRFTVGPELYLATVLDQAFQWRHLNAELIIGAHYHINDTFLVGLGVGPGLTQGAGTPTVRGLAHFAYAPVDREPEGPGDLDGDGVLDPDDMCPTVPQGDHPDPMRRGCPVLDTDGDGVFDHEDLCVTEPQGDHPDPARRGCPDGDIDHDGVLNQDDLCRETPQGDHPDPDRRGCPDGDIDHDGVLDHDDLCRETPQGPFPDPARRGCPLPDRDRDTVPDPQDRCPDRPGIPSSDPRRNGCPDEHVTISDGVINILQPVYFATDRDVILPRSEPVLRAVAHVLTAAPYIRRVRIEGHTDDANTEAYNLDLSNRRANNVMLWLTQHGIEAARLEARGFGESRPIRAVDGLTGNALRDARQLNRRVMFVIVDPAPPSGSSTPAR
jgi:outer membrane protein OmpA-like peptidoglycan-associated protein